MPYMSDARLAEVESRSRGDLGFALNNLLDDEEQEDAALVTLGDAAINGWTDAESDHVVAAFVVADRGWAKERSAEPWPEDECRRILTELGQFDDFDLDQLTTAGQMWQASPQPLATAYANGTLSARGVMAVVYRADSPQHHAGHNLPSDPEDPRRRHGAVRNLLGTVASRIP